MSGELCMESVDDDFARMLRLTSASNWAALSKFIEGLLGVDISEPRPHLIVVSTPRGDPYSFRLAGRDYLVLDQTFQRQVHRWIRSANLRESKPDWDPSAEFDEMYAQRAYI